MKRTISLLCLLGAPAVLSAAGIEYIGRATVPGSTLDLSGLTETITWPSGSMTHNQLGGFGSALAYTGVGNTFVAVNDRGPGDGAALPYYYDRFQIFSLTHDLATKTIEFKLMSTPLMTNGSGQHFNGNAADFNTVNPAQTMRFDPEGVTVAPDRTYFVSDEYGPYIKQFDQTGKLIKSIELPAKFAVANPNADANLELDNLSGRQTNRGMEGLTRTPDGRYLVGMMQNALIEDGGLDGTPSHNRVGLYNRIVKIDTVTGQTSEYLYKLDGISNGRGTNEILAVNDHQFLVLERDNKTFASSGTVNKKLFLIDTNGASDVSGVTDPTATFAGQTTVSKSLFLNLMDYPEFAADFPEKIEGLSFGALLADGRLPLYVTTDNDFIGANPSLIYGFAIDLQAAGLNYAPQQFAPEPGSFLMGGAALAGLIGIARAKGLRSLRR